MGRQRNPVDPKSYSGRIAARVRELREAQGKTVDGLAKVLGIKPNTLYKWEQGARDIPPDVYPKLAKALGVDAAEFFPKFR